MVDTIRPDFRVARDNLRTQAQGEGAMEIVTGDEFDDIVRDPAQEDEGPTREEAERWLREIAGLPTLGVWTHAALQRS